MDGDGYVSLSQNEIYGWIKNRMKIWNKLSEYKRSLYYGRITDPYIEFHIPGDVIKYWIELINSYEKNRVRNEVWTALRDDADITHVDRFFTVYTRVTNSL